MKNSISIIILATLFLFNGLSLAQTESLQELKDLIQAHIKADKNSEMVIASYKLQEMASRQNNIQEQVNAFKYIGMAYARLGANEQALEAYKKAVRLIDNSVSSEIVSSLYLGMSKILIDIGEYNEALKLISSGIALVESTDDINMLTRFYVNKGVVFTETKQYTLAKKAHEKVYMYLAKTNDAEILAVFKNSLGMNYKSQKKYSLALNEFQECLEIATKRKDNQMIVYSLLELGDINTILGNYELSRNYLDRALAISNTNDVVLWTYYSHDYLAKLDIAMGDKINASINNQKSEMYKQIMFNEKVENRAELLKVNVAVMEYKNNISLLEKDKEIQAIKLQQSKYMIFIIGIITFLISIALWITYRLYKLKEKANYKLKKMATTDYLTGLPNRRYLLEKVKTIQNNNAKNYQETVLIIIDLDHFKQVNDIHGHDHGDAVLIEVSKRMRNCLRQSDFIARWGGEEFLICLPKTGKSQALKLAEKIRTKISDSIIEFMSVNHQVTATLGVAISSDTDSFEKTLKLADEALYKGKKTGRNKIIIIDNSG